MAEINEAAKIITENIDPNAKVIFGAVESDKLKKGEIQITVIATGFSDHAPVMVKPMGTLSSGPSLFGDSSNNSDIFNKNPSEPKEPVKEFTDPSLEDDEMFEIPAFIRKKMK